MDGGYLERVQTGIKGLDSMLFGGIPAGNQVLVVGGPGAGKTLLSFEFLYRNALQGSKGIFFALEEQKDRLIENVKEAFSDLGKGIDEMISKGMLIIDGEDIVSRLNEGVTQPTYEFGKVVSDIETMVTDVGAKFVVIDPITSMSVILDDPKVYRRTLLALVANLRRLGLTSLITMEAKTPERKFARFAPEYYLFDGILSLYQLGEEEKRILAMEIMKMRGTNHSFVTSPYEITSSGFRVISAEDVALP